VKEAKVSGSDQLELDGGILKAKHMQPKNSRSLNLELFTAPIF